MVAKEARQGEMRLRFRLKSEKQSRLRLESERRPWGLEEYN